MTKNQHDKHVQSWLRNFDNAAARLEEPKAFFRGIKLALGDRSSLQVEQYLVNILEAQNSLNKAIELLGGLKA